MTIPNMVCFFHVDQLSGSNGSEVGCGCSLTPSFSVTPASYCWPASWSTTPFSLRPPCDGVMPPFESKVLSFFSVNGVVMTSNQQRAASNDELCVTVVHIWRCHAAVYAVRMCQAVLMYEKDNEIMRHFGLQMCSNLDGASKTATALFQPPELPIIAHSRARRREEHRGLGSDCDSAGLQASLSEERDLKMR